MTKAAQGKAAQGKDFNLDYLLHPAGAFRTPMEVVNDPDMTVQEKRAILAAWASDACAVEASPELREPSPATVVRFDDIMEALKRLDGEAANNPNYCKFINRAQRWKDLYRGERRSSRLSGRGTSLLRVLVPLALVSVALIQDAHAQSLARRTDAQDSRPFESFIPPVSPAVPWLNLDTKIRLPKGDYPIGRNAEVAAPVLRAPHSERADIAASTRGGG